MAPVARSFRAVANVMATAGFEATMGRAREWFHAILLAEGAARHGLSFAMGAIAVLAMQPIDFLPAFLVSFPVMIWILDGISSTGGSLRSNLLAASGAGWSFGFGYFMAGLWWLGSAFIVGGDEFVWLLPLGVIGLPAVLAFFPALGFALARLIWSASPMRVFALAFGLGISEWLRSWLFTGFPWNSFGQAFANHLVLAQIVSIIGADGLGVVAIILFASPAVIVSGQTAPARWGLPAASAAILMGIAGFGLLRLQETGGVGVDFQAIPMVPDVRLRIMQPNIAQEIKNSGARSTPDDGMKVLEGFFHLSDRTKGSHASGVADVTHLIWPEAPFPFILERNTRALEAIKAYLPAQTQLITGSIRAERDETVPRGFRFMNSLQVFNRQGVAGTYDKVHLVPFGEYLPFDRVLRAAGLDQFVDVIGGFTASPARRPLQITNFPAVIPAICFEAIFSRELMPEQAPESVVINVTNDAWFGYTFGPYQHLAQSRLRAIEFGHPLVRAANSGISAVFDPYGRELASLPLGIADVLDSPLPISLSKTLYRQTSWFSFVSVMILCLVLAMTVGRQHEANR
jgi:apolipoprotein N-acyltransferase